MIRIGDTFQALRTLEGYKSFRLEKTGSSLRLAGDAILKAGNSVDVSWLPEAANQYIISPNINDYIICDIPIVHADIPNRNLDEFPLQELNRFNTQTGRVVYKSFIGKPTHKDHDNKDPRRAKGVIFDASMDRMADGRFAVRILAGFDRTKDPHLCDEIFSGKRPGHSMGAMVGYTACPYPNCLATSTTGQIMCAHLEGNRGKGKVVNGFLMYERCYAVDYIESSSVGDAANYFAQQVWAR